MNRRSLLKSLMAAAAAIPIGAKASASAMVIFDDQEAPVEIKTTLDKDNRFHGEVSTVLDNKPEIIEYYLKFVPTVTGFQMRGKISFDGQSRGLLENFRGLKLGSLTTDQREYFARVAARLIDTAQDDPIRSKQIMSDTAITGLDNIEYTSSSKGFRLEGDMLWGTYVYRVSMTYPGLPLSMLSPDQIRHSVNYARETFEMKLAAKATMIADNAGNECDNNDYLKERLGLMRLSFTDDSRHSLNRRLAMLPVPEKLQDIYGGRLQSDPVPLRLGKFSELEYGS